MKKLLIVFVVLTFILSGCSGIFNREESNADYRLLANQYNEFLNHDINQYEQFIEFANHVSLNETLASVVVEVQLYDNKGTLLESRLGSGTIFYVDTLYYHVLTTYELTYVERGTFVTYRITDVFGINYRAVLKYESDDYEMSGLAFVKDQKRQLKSLAIANYEPLVGEPVMLIGYQKQLINSKTMGFITNRDSSAPNFMTADIDSDLYGNGGAIINIQGELIGIQDHYEDNLIYLIDHSTIATFFRLYVDSLFTID